MKEYFVVSRSFQAPIISDTIEEYVKGETPEAALEDYAGNYKYDAGLYAANLYRDADSYHRAEKPLAVWWSNKAIYQQEGKNLPPEVNKYEGRLIS